MALANPAAQSNTAAYVDDAVRRIRSVLPARRPLSLQEPVMGEPEAEAVAQAVRTGWVSSVGPDVTAFEEQVKQRTGAGYVIAVCNGTAALHLAVIGAGVDADCEVMMPAITFAASAAAVRYAGAFPHFVDSEPDRLGLDPLALEQRLAAIAQRAGDHVINKETGRRIAAILCVHIFGHAVRLEEIKAVAAQYGLPVVEDAAACMGSIWQERHLGTFGEIGAISFNGNKIMTTGGGGAVLCRDDETGRKLRHLATTARVASPIGDFMHDAVGFNYRMPNLNAAMGLAQMGRLDFHVRVKRRLYHRYADAFADFSGARILREPEGGESNYWLQALILDKPDSGLRDQILKACQAEGILARPLWHPLHQLEPYRDMPRGDLRVAEALHARVINLPSGPDLADPERDAT